MKPKPHLSPQASALSCLLAALHASPIPRSSDGRGGGLGTWPRLSRTVVVLGRGHSLLRRRRSGSAAALSDGGARAPPRSASPSLTPSSSTSSLVKNDTSYTQLDAPYLTACSAPSPAAAGNAPFPSDGFVPLGCVCTCSLANVLVGSEF
jgi:hypothetical protein